MKRPTWKALPLAMLLAVPCYGATVCGTARNINGRPIGGVQLIAKDTRGKLLGSGTTAADGKYRIEGVPQGPIDLFCNPASEFQPGSGALTLTDANGRVNWQLSNASPAAAAKAGTCDPAGLTDAEIGSIAVLGLAGAGGIAGLVVGVDQGGDPSSPTNVRPITPAR